MLGSSIGEDMAAQTAFNPIGKSFNQRLDACLSDALKKYNIKIRKDTGRTAEWQQKLHIAHMFLYNKLVPINTSDELDHVPVSSTRMTSCRRAHDHSRLDGLQVAWPKECSLPGFPSHDP